VEGVLAVVDQLAGKALPASAWESLVLPSRVADYSPAMLDELLGAGEVVWTGAGSLPGRDGWVQLHPADLVLPALRDTSEPDELGDAILRTLHGGGAFLFRQICDALHEPDHTLVADALWRLVWSGRVAGDTFAPVRAMLGGRGAHRSTSRSPRARLRTARARPSSLRSAQLGPPIVTGRWFELEPAETDPTKLQLARTEALLARHGVVTRGSVNGEQTPGGFAATYRVLRELEQTGACLRGYFVDSLGAAQFASSSAINRLRSFQRDEDADRSSIPALVLAATDPANPFGAALPWPDVVDAAEGSGHRPARKAGALVVIHDGHPVLYLERGGRTVLVLDDDGSRLGPAALALANVVHDGHVPRLTINTVAGRPVGTTPLGEALREAGFREHPKGLRLDARR
jgi:ATP-dependent Lhr-like helicase